VWRSPTESTALSLKEEDNVNFQEVIITVTSFQVTPRKIKAGNWSRNINSPKKGSCFLCVAHVKNCKHKTKMQSKE
jgi:hypothetical protein